MFESTCMLACFPSCLCGSTVVTMLLDALRSVPTLRASTWAHTQPRGFVPAVEGLKVKPGINRITAHTDESLITLLLTSPSESATLDEIKAVGQGGSLDWQPVPPAGQVANTTSTCSQVDLLCCYVAGSSILTLLEWQVCIEAVLLLHPHKDTA